MFSRFNHLRVVASGSSQLIFLGGTLGTNIVIFGLNVLTAAIAARLLGPTGRGELAAIQNWAFFAVIWGSLGIPVAASFFSGRHHVDAGRLFSTALLFLAVITVPLVGIMFVAIPYLLAAQSEEIIFAARMFLLFIPIQLATLVPYHIFHGLNRLNIWNILRILMPFLWLLVFLIGILRGGIDAISASHGYVFAAAIYCVAWLLVMFLLIRESYRLDIIRLPAMVRYGLPTMFATVPRQLNLRVDQLIMAAFLSAQALGFYVVAAAWGGLIGPVMISISQVIFPRMAGSERRDEQNRLFQRSLSMSISVGVILTGTLLIITPFMIPLIFGVQFEAAVSPAIILVIAGLFSSLNNMMGEAFRGMGLPKNPMVAEISGLVITITLLLLLLPRYQIMGAAFASLVSYVTTFGILLALVRAATGIGILALVIPSRENLATIRYYYDYITKRG